MVAAAAAVAAAAVAVDVVAAVAAAAAVAMGEPSAEAQKSPHATALHASLSRYGLPSIATGLAGKAPPHLWALMKRGCGGDHSQRGGSESEEGCCGGPSEEEADE